MKNIKIGLGLLFCCYSNVFSNVLLDKYKDLAIELKKNNLPVYAVNCYKDALELFPDDIELLRDIGLEYYYLEKFDQALNPIEKLSSFLPQSKVHPFVKTRNLRKS